MIYLDNSATSFPKPETVYRTMDRFLREKGGNAGHGSHSLAVAALQTIDETRALTARFIHAPEVERVIFTLNCTDSINLGLKGILKPGDHVITSRLEHNAVLRPLAKLEEKGITVTKLPISAETGAVLARDIEKAITPETRMIVMVHISNATGVIQPVQEYGALARKYNLIFLADAAQSVGHYPVDVQAANIDLLAFSGHKGPFGPPGVGVLYIGRRIEPDTLREGGTGTFSESEKQPDTWPNKYESGTMNSVGIAGLGAGLKFIQEEGPEKIMEREGMLADALIEGLAQIAGVKLYIVKDKSKRGPVVSFNIEGYEPGEVGAILDQAFDIKVRTGLHCAPIAHKSLGTFPRGTVRVSPGYFNTPGEIETALQSIVKIARSKN
jgi:cysteine desulfurase / selenocysteine lyase